MPDSETYDVWVINDPDGPVLYFPVPSSSAAPPSEHVARHRQHAARASAPEGLIEGVWSRARQRLAGGASLVAEIADPEVETRRAAQRAATMARGADAVAWAPEELLAEPEPAPKKRAAPRSRPSASSSGTAAPRTAAPRPTRPRPAPKPKPAPPAKPAEPEERMCPSCFMMRSPDQFPADADVCEFCG